MLITRTRTGFTLIELLLVIGIIAILASIVITAIDPGAQLRKAFGQERTHTAKQVQQAMYQYMIDVGVPPGNQVISTNSGTPTLICRLGQNDGSCINIDRVAPEYMSCLPYDTLETNPELSGFSVYETSGFLTVTAEYDSLSATGGTECLEPPTALSSFTLGTTLAATIRDDTNSYTATVNNMIAPSGPAANGPSGVSATSWLFDGSNDTLSIAYTPEFDFTEALTLGAWVYPTSFGAADTVNAIVRKGEANPNIWQLAIEDGYATLMLEQGDGSDGRAQSSSQLTLNTWQHVAGTWDGTTATVYVDGVAVDSNAYSGTNGGALATDARDVYIGGRAGSDYFDGNLYDVRMFNSALTETQINYIIDGVL